MRFLIKLIAVLLVLSALVFTAGTILPKQHSVSRSIPIAQPADTVWKVITDYPAITEWHAHIKSVTQLDNSSEGNNVWRFEDKRGHYMVLEEVEKQAPHKLITRIVKTDCPFGGEWVFELRENGEGTVLTITENGTIRNPVLRVFSRYILGYNKGIKMYEDALLKKLEAPEETKTE